ncbi:MAG: lamin tail domain-containing protein [Prevotella sp.]|nr:lamin tail domain-containing protein [Prevotella sp.]
MLATTLATAVLVVNELMAANVGEAMSPAVNFDSWIELYNPGDKPVSLGGMYLSDDANNPTLWQMPDDMGSVPAGGFKVIWLGSNDIKATQAPFKLDCDGGAVYLYDSNGQLVTSVDYPAAISHTAWARQTDGGSDWGWTSTVTPGATNATALFAQKRLDAPEVSVDSRLFTGTLKVSVSIPEGATLMYTTDGSLPSVPTESDAQPDWVDYIVNGDCEGSEAGSLAARNYGGEGDDYTLFDGIGHNGSRGIKVHTGKGAKNDHDAQLFVYTPDHIWRSGERYRFHMMMRADKAARINAQTHTTPHNYIHWQMFDGSTINVTDEWQAYDFEGTITDDQVGKQGGGWWGGEETVKDMQTIAFNLNVDRTDNNFYFDDVTWELYTGDAQTTNTSKESKDGQFTISNTTALTVRLFQDGLLPSVPVTRSYIKTTNQYTLPIVSIVGDKRYFTDPKIGFDCDGDGTNGKTGNGQDWPRNYNQDWDRPVNFSYLSPEGRMLFNQDVNICASGGFTRSQRFRSFKLKANKAYDGLNRFDYSFFPQKPYIRNKTLLVRNGGNDVWRHNARFIDPALETIIQRSGIDVDVQSYLPVVEYVNGELRGVLNLREPNNDKFAYANWGYDDEELDAFENLEMKNGTDDAINRIFELGRHINDDGAYDELKTLLNIDEFTNYMAVTLYLFNDDWPDNNIKGYRSRLDGRYRFISFDLDYAFGACWSDSGVDPFAFFSKFQNAGKTNQEFVRLFLNLLDNDTYRRKFIDTFCLVGGSVFEPKRAAQIVDELLAEVKPMTQLMKQLGINDGTDPDRAASTIKSNLEGRSEQMTGYMKQFSAMKLSSTSRQSVTLTADAKGARLSVNGINVPYADFKGHLFAPVRLEAEAPAGYRFAGWKKGSTVISTDAAIDLPAGNSVALTATFAPLSNDERQAEGITPVRVNEVSASNGIYVNEYFKRNDWIELYNTTDQAVDVAGMYLSDNPQKPQKYQIAAAANAQASTVIPAHGYLVVWCDKLEPLSQLHTSFKLAADGGDVLLTAADLSWTDRLTYGPMKADETAGRYPDGSASVITMNLPTIEQANMKSTYATPVEQAATDGITDIAIASGLTVRYVVGSLVLRSATDGPVSISIVNMAGQRVASFTGHLTAGRAEIPLTLLKNGAYTATVTDSHGHRTTLKFLTK